MFRVMLAALIMLLFAERALGAGVDRPPPAVMQQVEVSIAATSQPTAALDQRATTLSQSLSKLTGLGISPLVTMAALSLMEWWTHDPAKGPAPWHASGWFAWSLFTIAVLALLLKLLGTRLPAPIQKFQRAFEHQARCITGLIAAGTFVPMIAAALDTLSAGAEPTGSVAGQVLATPQAAGLGQLTSVMVALVVMALAWTVSQGIESLIFLSPFAVLDAALLSLRGFLLGLIVTAAVFAQAHPLLVSLPILGCMLLVFLLVAGWCVRLNGFVATYALDILLRRWRRPEMARAPYLAFLGRGSGLAPARVRCRLERHGESLSVRWRRGFVGPERQVHLQASTSTMVRGVLWPEVQTCTADGRRFWLWLPPRYRAHQDAVMATLRIDGRDGIVLKGWAGMRALLRALWPVRSPVGEGVVVVPDSRTSKEDR